MKQRLEQFLAAENLTKAQFADRINVARAGITHIMSGRNNPSYEFIVNTMNAFPDLNIEWLLKGTGRMYKSYGSSDASHFESDTLFHDAVVDAPTQETAATSAITSAVEQVAQTPALHSVSPTTPTGKSGISRIVVFFEDGTFRDFC